MPREARPPLDSARTKGILSPQKSPMKYDIAQRHNSCAMTDSSARIPLNDDRAEKSVRFQSRQALHEIQMNQIKAAATPVRKRRSLAHPSSGSPRTPSTQTQDNEGSPGLAVVGSAVTPMKRVPILANFEEWMKMATDNVRLRYAQNENREADTHTEDKRREFLELCPYRLLSRHVLAKGGRWGKFPEG